MGIEILESLYDQSTELKTLSGSNFEVICGDILADNVGQEKFDWVNQADFVLINSTCFDLKLIGKIARKASAMKIGSWLLSVSKQLPEANHWTCVLSVKLPMSWGDATVFVHKKIA